MAKKKMSSEKKVNFKLEAIEAKEVMLSGDFNDWDMSMYLTKGKDKTWKKTVTLKPGRYEYKFIVDGTWTIDPNNNNKVWNSIGSENSVIEI